MVEYEEFYNYPDGIHYFIERSRYSMWHEARKKFEEEQKRSS